MSAPAKRTVLVLVAAILMAAVSTVFAVTLARLMRQHHTEDAGDSAASDSDTGASTPPVTVLTRM